MVVKTDPYITPCCPQRIDLRDNNLQVAGLMALVLSMRVNRSVSQLDLDDTPRRKHSMVSVVALYGSVKLCRKVRILVSRISRNHKSLTECVGRISNFFSGFDTMIVNMNLDAIVYNKYFQFGFVYSTEI